MQCDARVCLFPLPLVLQLHILLVFKRSANVVSTVVPVKLIEFDQTVLYLTRCYRLLHMLCCQTMSLSATSDGCSNTHGTGAGLTCPDEPRASTDEMARKDIKNSLKKSIFMCI